MFKSESTLYTCRNVKELVARGGFEIRSFSDCNWTQTHNNLIDRRKFKYLAKLAKCLSCIISTYL